MSVKYGSIALKALLLATAITVAWASRAQSPAIAASPSDNPLSLVISAPSDTVATGSSITIHVSLANTTQETLTIGRSLGIENAHETYLVQIDSVAGGVSSTFMYNQMLHKYKHPPSVLSTYLEEAKPGQTYNEDISLAAIDDLSKPGKYGISVSRDVVVDGKLIHLQSNRITISVR